MIRRSQRFEDLATLAIPTQGVAGPHLLRPAEADFVEVEIGVLRTDVMEHAGDSAAYSVIEAFCRVGVNEAARISPLEWRIVSWAAKASPIEMNDFHSSLIRCVVTSTFSLSTRRASFSERSSTTRALASPATAPSSASTGRCTTARTGVFVVRGWPLRPRPRRG